MKDSLVNKGKESLMMPVSAWFTDHQAEAFPNQVLFLLMIHL